MLADAWLAFQLSIQKESSVLPSLSVTRRSLPSLLALVKLKELSSTTCTWKLLREMPFPLFIVTGFRYVQAELSHAAPDWACIGNGRAARRATKIVVGVNNLLIVGALKVSDPTLLCISCFIL